MEHFELLMKAPVVDQISLDTIHQIQRKFEKEGWRVPNTLNDQDKQLWIIEIGSVGVFRGYCDEHGHWIIESDDIYPSYPFMVKAITDLELGNGFKATQETEAQQTKDLSVQAESQTSSSSQHPSPPSRCSTTDCVGRELVE